MLGNLNQVAIAVPDVKKAAELYKKAFNAEVGEPESLPEHGVTVVMVYLPNTHIELIEPLGDNSPIAGFLKKNPEGGIHHIGFDIKDLAAAKAQVSEAGVRVLGSGEPKIGAHGNPVLFLHPKDLCGTLIEFEEVTDEAGSH